MWLNVFNVLKSGGSKLTSHSRGSDGLKGSSSSSGTGDSGEHFEGEKVLLQRVVDDRAEVRDDA
jgi:hypothetical protein